MINQFKNLLSARLYSPINILEPVGGGCINQTYKIVTPGRFLFCKVNSATKFPHLFEKEKNGLALLEKQNIIKVPGVINHFISDDWQVLVLEWIEEGTKNNQFWKRFGQQLAVLHQITNEYFGLPEDNFMGSVPQSNKQYTSWVSFFIEERLQPLITLCSAGELISSQHQSQFEVLFKRLPEVFDQVKPALVHGDLWSGNFMCTDKQQPVLIDPACYFGHPSVDLAMTTLFGGFDKTFYESYNYYSPLPSNYKEQWEVCNIYPLLIHLYLFGKSYLHQIESTLNRFA